MFEQYMFVHVGLLHSEDEEQKNVHCIKAVIHILNNLLLKECGMFSRLKVYSNNSTQYGSENK